LEAYDCSERAVIVGDIHFGHVGIGARVICHVDELGVCVKLIARYAKLTNPGFRVDSICSVRGRRRKENDLYGILGRNNGRNVLYEPPLNIGHAFSNASDVDPVSELGQ
jgi:hypothetical protein